MSLRLENKVCFVTGAAQGIGRQTVEAFLREGAHVIAADINEPLLAELDAMERVRTVVVDVTDVSAVRAAAAGNPQASVLVNCAGCVASGSLLNCDVEVLEQSFQVNVVSMYYTIRAFLPKMLKRREGSIINVASVVSSIRSAPDRFAYGTTKAAVIGLTKAVARDYISQGIRCNVVSPGTISTPSLEQRVAATGDVAAARAAFVARQPMGRLGTPEEVAAVMVMLASDETRFMTGSNIVIDGGMSL